MLPLLVYCLFHVVNYLIKAAAHWSFAPFLPTKLDKLSAQPFVRVLCQLIVDAGELLSEEALFSALPSKGTSTGLVLWRI